VESTVGLDDPQADAPEGSADRPTIMFVHPVPGFPGLREFALIGLDDETDADPAPSGAEGTAAEAMLYELRSVEQPAVRFMVATAYAFFPDYDIEIDDQVCENLDLHDAADALILVILTVGADISSTTANLLAPVIVNSRNKSAAQVILSGSEWPVRAPLG
jgi:flagellar assembly factor FliW